MVTFNPYLNNTTFFLSADTSGVFFQGFNLKDGGGIDLISNVVEEMLKIPCAVLMGANIANEVASENYCEATIGKPYNIITMMLVFSRLYDSHDIGK